MRREKTERYNDSQSGNAATAKMKGNNREDGDGDRAERSKLSASRVIVSLF